MAISPNQKNIFYKEIESHKLNVRDFSIISATDSFRITHKLSKAYFRIALTEVKNNGPLKLYLFAYYTPSAQNNIYNLQKEASYVDSDTFDKLAAAFKRWLLIIKSEYSVPDLWSEMDNEPSMFSESSTLEDELFTETEIKLLEGKLPCIEERVDKIDLPPDAKNEVMEIIRKVPAKAIKFTKQDLANNLIGSLVKVGFKWHLTTNDMNETWFACQSFFTLSLPG